MRRAALGGPCSRTPSVTIPSIVSTCAWGFVRSVWSVTINTNWRMRLHMCMKLRARPWLHHDVAQL